MEDDWCLWDGAFLAELLVSVSVKTNRSNQKKLKKFPFISYYKCQDVINPCFFARTATACLETQMTVGLDDGITNPILE